MKRRAMSLLVVAAIASVLLVGCGSNGGTSENSTNVDDNGYEYVEQSIGVPVLKRAIDGSPQLSCTFYYFDNEKVDKSSFLMQKLVDDLPEDTVSVTAGTQGSKGLVQYTFAVYANEENHPLACAVVYLTENGVVQKRTVNKRLP